MMGRKHPDTHEQAQAVLYAELHGDEAAAKRFNLSVRSLRNYRALAREEGTEIAEIFRAYRGALAETPERAATFADWLTDQVRTAAGLLVEKARQADARNPETLRVLNEHVATLLDHQTATDYIARLFPAHDADRDPEAAPD